VSALDRILDAFTNTIKVGDRVARMAGEVKDLAKEVRGMDGRLIRVETTLDLVVKGAVRPAVGETAPRLPASDNER
jgi:hypothetical protein